ncbi:hypothetical protein CEXT_1501 [Caerostris extrusa]|uniref:Uncharacterized protein n=1 Tax=Caerostris extrusa TaxID=172846 RepID=A0AAV4VL41_CAEEX|nr:hypothetical protein CEXT_1501 [Caerostris extrusa]
MCGENLIFSQQVAHIRKSRRGDLLWIRVSISDVLTPFAVARLKRTFDFSSSIERDKIGEDTKPCPLISYKNRTSQKPPENLFNSVSLLNVISISSKTATDEQISWAEIPSLSNCDSSNYKLVGRSEVISAKKINSLDSEGIFEIKDQLRDCLIKVALSRVIPLLFN